MLRMQLKLLLSARNRVFGMQSCYKTLSCQNDNPHIPKRQGCVTCTQSLGCCKAASNLMGHDTSQSQTASQQEQPCAVLQMAPCASPRVPVVGALPPSEASSRPPLYTVSAHSIGWPANTAHTLPARGRRTGRHIAFCSSVDPTHARLPATPTPPHYLQTPCIRLPTTPTAHHSTPQQG